MNNPNEINPQNLKLTTHYMWRPRLDKLLNQAVRSKLVYVIAGVGHGKTQAIRHYVKKQEHVVRWMQLVESDNIASCFWESLTHTISVDNPTLAAHLRDFGFPETLASFNQFAKIIRDTKFSSSKAFFVLDDFHLIHSKEVLLFVERFVHLQISGVCMFILSRKEPDINVVSLIAKEKVRIITEDDLRFTDTEASELFRQQEIPLSTKDISQLISITKGWALALNMLSLISNKVPDNFNYALELVMENIFKLIAREAWDDFPEDVQKAVVKLSLLSDLPIASLQEISDEAEFWKETPGLASFIWHDTFTNDLKIHSLYLEFLQTKHDILSHEEKQEAYRRAASWCSDHQLHMSAMYYYGQSGQFDRMIQTLLSYPLKLSRDTSEYLLDILENLAIINGEQVDSDLLFLKSFFIPLLLIGVGRYEEAKERSLSVISQWEQVDSPLATLLLYTSYSNLAYIDMYTCIVTHKYEAPIYLKKSVEYFKQTTLTPTKASGAFISGDLRSFACLVGEGASITEFDQFLEAAKETELLIEETRHSVYAGYGDLVACELAFFKNQPELARTHAHKAVLRGSAKNQYSIVAMAEKYLLSIAIQEGNVSLARELLKQLATHLDNPDFWNRQLYYDLYTGVFYAKIGLFHKVSKWYILDEKEVTSEIKIPARELYLRVLYFIAAKKYQQALTILCNSYPREPGERFLFGELRLSLLTAVARIQTDDTSGAMTDFENAYELSYQGMFEMAFIELGRELHPLVVAGLKQEDCKIPKDWLKSIDRKASIYGKKVAIVTNAFQPNIKEIVPLSNRELEVLLDLYHGLSREEIAENRYLSINTVKKTLQSIYIKLGAYNNVDAIRIALERKMIK
jgi:LuxR family maltose regulon positive regulatory protein